MSSSAISPALLQASLSEKEQEDFPGGPVVQNLPAKAGDMGSIPGSGRSHMPGATKPMYHNY